MEISNLLGKIHNIDCLELMRKLPDKCVDLVLTDPPYDESTHKGAITGTSHSLGISFAKIKNYDFLRDLVRISRSWVLVFMPVESLGLVKKQFPDYYIRGGIWDRICNTPQISGDRPAQAVEGIAILHDKGKKKWNGGGKSGIWRDMVERGTKEHETQKPIGLNVLILEDFSNKDYIVFDPFMGSGTTAVACERLGRRWFGCELEPKYVAIANKRIEAERAQLKLF